MENVDFGQAIKALKEGKRVARKGWNGKGMFIFQRPADELTVDFIVNKVKSLPDSVKRFFDNDHINSRVEVPKTELKIKFSAYLCMYAADGSIVNGWLASQTDMLAEDWVVLD